MIIVKLLLSLGIILLSCELFTNGIEWFGKKLKMGDGVVGSIFSAIGTCLPETMVPIIAILFSGGSKDRVDIGIGAIMGAPFMLSTLAFFVTGVSVLVFWKSRKTGMKMKVNIEILRRDIVFFLIVYTLGVSATFLNARYLKVAIAVILISCYIYYIFLTIKRDAKSHGELEDLYFSRVLKRIKPELPAILTQLIGALLGIVFGAHLFVANVEVVSKAIGVAPLILSLIITPIATELPEKFNSIIWISRKKDTLSMGNITGAMVFQSCIPVTIGILSTNWVLDNNTLFSAAIALFSGLITYLYIKLNKKLTPIPLIFGGVLYVIFILYVI